MDQKPLGTVTGTEVTDSGLKIFATLTEEGLDYVNELLRKTGEYEPLFTKLTETEMTCENVYDEIRRSKKNDS